VGGHPHPACQQFGALAENIRNWRDTKYLEHGSPASYEATTFEAKPVDDSKNKNKPQPNVFFACLGFHCINSKGGAQGISLQGKNGKLRHSSRDTWTMTYGIHSSLNR
jgi:hypothetical protein